MIIADADDADDDDSDLPADSGSEIEFESESEYTDSDTTDEEELADNVFNDGMVSCWGLRTRGGSREPKNELIRKRLNSPNMKDGESRPVLRQVQRRRKTPLFVANVATKVVNAMKPDTSVFNVRTSQRFV